MTWSFYDPSTGLLRPKRVTCPASYDVRARAPEGCVPIEGVFDHERQRIDVQSVRGSENADWQGFLNDRAVSPIRVVDDPVLAHSFEQRRAAARQRAISERAASPSLEERVAALEAALAQRQS